MEIIFLIFLILVAISLPRPPFPDKISLFPPRSSSRTKSSHRQPSRQRTSRSKPSSQKAKVPSSTAVRDSSVSPRLWRQLTHLAGNEKTARRLIKNLMIRHPERDGDWCCEKAIYDLTRDRHRV